jgi:hypothetical protein
MDEFLDLQDQNTTTLLSTEQIEQPEHVEEEWHSVTPIEDMLSSDTEKGIHTHTYQKKTTNKFIVANWSLLQNGLDSLQGINLTDIIQNSFSQDNNDHCITPDFLIKQQPMTRSRTAVKNEKIVKEEPKKKTRAKRLYCFCKQPYNGKPMVQCDRCEEW